MPSLLRTLPRVMVLVSGYWMNEGIEGISYECYDYKYRGYIPYPESITIYARIFEEVGRVWCIFMP